MLVENEPPAAKAGYGLLCADKLTYMHRDPTTWIDIQIDTDADGYTANHTFRHIDIYIDVVIRFHPLLGRMQCVAASCTCPVPSLSPPPIQILTYIMFPSASFLVCPGCVCLPFPLLTIRLYAHSSKLQSFYASFF